MPIVRPLSSLVWRENEVTDRRTQGHQAFLNRSLNKISKLLPRFTREGLNNKSVWGINIFTVVRWGFFWMMVVSMRNLWCMDYVPFQKERDWTIDCSFQFSGFMNTTFIFSYGIIKIRLEPTQKGCHDIIGKINFDTWTFLKAYR